MALIGEVVLFAGNYAPMGWKDCNGQMLNCWNEMALYGILGDKYGGDGMDNFALPNMAPVPDSDGIGSSRYIICTSGTYPNPPY